MREIADKLQVPLSDIQRDINYLRRSADTNIRHYIDEYLPTEYENTLDILDLIIKEMWTAEIKDNRDLVQTRQLIKDCCAMRIELIGSTQVIDRAIRFVNKHRDLGRGYTDENSKVVVHVQPET
jgi:hypothetical protein